jgi:Heterokaryon incompatibility protein (HET)
VCINQEDLDERSSQVLLMPSIYAKASIVFAWLGPAALDSDLAMKHIETLTAKLKEGMRASHGTDASGYYEVCELL